MLEKIRSIIDAYNYNNDANVRVLESGGGVIYLSIGIDQAQYKDHMVSASMLIDGIYGDQFVFGGEMSFSSGLFFYKPRVIYIG